MEERELTLGFDNTHILRICRAVEAKDRSEIVSVRAVLDKELKSKKAADVAQALSGIRVWLLDETSSGIVWREILRTLETALTIHADFDALDENSVDFDMLGNQFRMFEDGGNFYSWFGLVNRQFRVTDDEAQLLAESNELVVENLVRILPEIMKRHPSLSVARLILDSFYTYLLEIGTSSFMGVALGRRGIQRKMPHDIAEIISGTRALRVGCHFSEATGIASIWPIMIF